MGVRYRCSKRKCHLRVTLNKNNSLYLKPKVCKECGSKLTLVEDQRRAESKLKTCYCDGLSFPHRRKSKWCNYYTKEYSQEDLNERHC